MSILKQNVETTPNLKRRRFVQVIAAAGALGSLWHFGLRDKILDRQVVRQSRAMMGTQINLIVYGPDKQTCEEAIQATFSRMQNLVESFSRHCPTSELSTLNRTGKLENPGKDLRQVFLLANKISNLTQGSFDVTVLPLLDLYQRAKASSSLPPKNELAQTLQLVDYQNIDIKSQEIALKKKGMSITLDGIGKGYIVDQGVRALKSRGFNSVYVEAGGDLMVTGTKNGNKPWQIGIRNPRIDSPDQLVAMGLTEKAVATSGDYMQFFTSDLKNHHIINPRTGISPPELASATVIAPTVALADGLATAAMVMGSKKSQAMLQSIPGCEGLFIGKDLKRTQTSGFTG